MFNNQNNRLLRSGLVALSLCGIAGTAAAATGDTNRQSMSDVPFTGPLVAPNATALPPGHWDIEPYLLDQITYGQYDNDWHQTNVPDTHAFLSVTLLQYGVTDRFSVGLLPSFGFIHPGNGSNTDGLQMGDTTLRLQYMFHQFQRGSWLPTMAIGIDQNLPTGDYDGLDKVTNGLGSGVWSTKVGLWTQDYFWMPNGHILRTRLDLSYEFPDDNTSINGRSVYGTGPSFSGKIHPADSFTADAAMEYGLTRHWAPVFEVVYQYTGNGQVTGAQSTVTNSGLVQTHVNNNTGSSQYVEVAPAIEYLWNEHFGLIAGAEVSLAGQNTGAFVTPEMALNMFF